MAVIPSRGDGEDLSKSLVSGWLPSPSIDQVEHPERSFHGRPEAGDPVLDVVTEERDPRSGFEK